jgi:guanylate kinase
LLEIDLQGARQVRDTWPDAQFVFLAPPSWEELVRRLVGRGTESAAQQERRLETARAEMAAQAEFDRVVVNGEIGQAVQDLVALVYL